MRAFLIALSLFVVPLYAQRSADELLRDAKQLHEDAKRAVKEMQNEERLAKNAKLAREREEREEQYQMGQAFVIAIGFGILVWLWRRKPN